MLISPFDDDADDFRADAATPRATCYALICFILHCRRYAALRRDDITLRADIMLFLLPALTRCCLIRHYVAMAR